MESTVEFGSRSPHRVVAGRIGSTSSRNSASPASVSRPRPKPIPYITTYIEKVDEYCIVIRGMFGGLGTREDRRLARERSLAMEIQANHQPGPGPTRPPKSQQRMIDMSGEGRGKKPNAVARFFYWMGKICWVGCCPPFPSTIIHKIVFQPPSEPSYSFIAPDGTKLSRSNLRKYDDPKIQFSVTYTAEVMETVMTPIDLSQLRGFIVRKSSGSHVAGAYLPATDSPFLFIYSHANAMDIGFTIPFMFKLRRKLGCSVVTYDYSGYGLSFGSCTESDFFGDAEAVFSHVTETLGLVSAHRVILYGFSLGTAATAHLARKTPDLAAVVLSGAFISAVNCLRRIPSDREYTCQSIDKFRTYQSVPLISAPTLVCHGLEDHITGMEQGLWILERCKRPLEPLFLPDTDHNDMDKPPVWSRLRQMIHHDLHAPQPHAALRSRLEELLRQLFPEMHQRCLDGPAVCLACRTSVARSFFEPKRLDIIGLSSEFVESARRIRWEVEPRSSDDGGSWEGRFTIILFSALVSGPEIRLLAEHNDRALPDPPDPTSPSP